MKKTNQCSKRHRQCRFAERCSDWQWFKCAFVHDMSTMRCSVCDQNHRAANCPQKNQQNRSTEKKEKEYPRYNGTDYFTSKVKPKSEENRFAPSLAASVTPRTDKVLALCTKRLRMSDAEKDIQLRAAYEVVAAAKNQTEKSQRPQ